MKEKQKNENVFNPKKNTFVKDLSDVFCGYNQTFLIDFNHNCYVFGNNEYNLLGIQSDELHVNKPTENTALRNKKITHVVFGERHALAWSSQTKEVYSWGYGSFGKSIEDDEETSNLPLLVETFREAREVAGMCVEHLACGQEISLGIFSCNEEIEATGTKLLFWGSHKYIDISEADRENVTNEPHDMPFDVWNGKLMKVHARHRYSVVLTEEGQVYSWGSNEFGRLGFDTGKRRFSKVPKNVSFPNKTKIMDIALGMYHVLCIDLAGCVYSWGHGLHGELGNGQSINSFDPIHIVMPVAVKSVACGNTHSIALGEDGNVYSWGWGNHGQLGLGSQIAAGIPNKVDRLNCLIKKIACGSQHTCVISESNVLYVFGDNQFGQLGLQKENNQETSKKGKIENNEIMKQQGAEKKKEISQNDCQKDSTLIEGREMDESLSELEFLKRRVVELEYQNDNNRILREEEVIFELAGQCITKLEEEVAKTQGRKNYIKSSTVIDKIHNDFKKDILQKSSSFHDNCSASLLFSLKVVGKMISLGKENLQLKHKMAHASQSNM